MTKVKSEGTDALSEEIAALQAKDAEQDAKLAGDHTQGLLPPGGRRLAPERVRELVPGNRPALLAHEIGEDETSLPPRQAVLVDEHPVRADRDASRQRDPDPHGS